MKKLSIFFGSKWGHSNNFKYYFLPRRSIFLWLVYSIGLFFRLFFVVLAKYCNIETNLVYMGQMMILSKKKFSQTIKYKTQKYHFSREKKRITWNHFPITQKCWTFQFSWVKNSNKRIDPCYRVMRFCLVGRLLFSPQVRTLVNF